MIKIGKRVPPVNEADLSSLETRVGVRFPEDYRNFLLLFNGGGPVEENSWLPLGQERWIKVDYFYSVIEREHEFYEILNQVKLYKGRIHSDFIPIAHDSYGNQIVLAVKGPFVGRVCFWDHEVEGIDERTQDSCDVVRLSQSFSGFLALLGAVER